MKMNESVDNETLVFFAISCLRLSIFASFEKLGYHFSKTPKPSRIIPWGRAREKAQMKNDPIQTTWAHNFSQITMSFTCETEYHFLWAGKRRNCPIVLLKSTTTLQKRAAFKIQKPQRLMSEVIFGGAGGWKKLRCPSFLYRILIPWARARPRSLW